MNNLRESREKWERREKCECEFKMLLVNGTTDLDKACTKMFCLSYIKAYLLLFFHILKQFSICLDSRTQKTCCSVELV